MSLGSYAARPKLMFDDEGVERAVCDYVSGMTDDYAVYKFNSIYIPKAWQVK